MNIALASPTLALRARITGPWIHCDGIHLRVASHHVLALCRELVARGYPDCMLLVADGPTVGSIHDTARLTENLKA